MIFVKKLSYFFLIVIFNFPFQVLAQQGNIWYFGIHAGLNFNTNPPTALVDGALDTNEGSASIADNNGNILFYTDGSTVYNRNHKPMPNGTDLSGHYSAAQSAIIVPKPGSAKIYYIFTAYEVGGYIQKGYNYNTVDITLDGGLGDITQKNGFLFGRGTEKLNAVRHANGIDVWVLTKVPQSNIFKAYKIDCNGIDTIPVVSVSGGLISPPEDYNDGGLLKFSADGKKLCQTFGGFNTVVQLSQFDNSTGIVSNSIEWNYPDLPMGLSYTMVEFSPSSSLLYVAFNALRRVEYSNRNLIRFLQHDVSVHTVPAIMASETLLYEYTEESYQIFVGVGVLQIAPDKKIYIARPGDTTLDVINNPDIPDLSCNLQQGAVHLRGKRVIGGLPTFMPNLFVNQQSTVNYTLNSDCATVNFSATTSLPGAVSWLWDFGDSTSSTAQNPVHTYSSSGNIYKVTLKVISALACNGFVAIEKDVNLNRIVPTPGFYFTGQCGSPSVSFFDTSHIAAGGTINYRLWDFGDGSTSALQNPFHNYPGIGNYTVKLTVGNTAPCGGNTTSTAVVFIESQPVAGFAITGGCAGTPVKFTDNSSITTGTISEWKWDFGDTDTSNLQNPFHTYNSPNNYTISLKVKSQTGCWSAEKQRAVSLSSKPVAKFGWQHTCANKSTLFTDSSSITTGNISNWQWNFGDGTSSLVQLPEHSYTTAGNYIVKLIATSSTGCASDTLSVLVAIGSKPTAAIYNSYACGVKDVLFRDTSTNLVGTINTWNWVFGDGSTAGTQHPKHSYAGFANYNVRLVVGTSLGCVSDTILKNIAVNAKPVAGFGSSSGCINVPVKFADSSTVEAAAISSYWWNAGDGFNSNASSFTHLYNTAGTYKIQMLVKTDNNCISDTAFRTITVEDKPVADFTAVSSCVGKQLVLQNNTTIGTGIIDHYRWSFGNGSSSTDKQPVFAYPIFGDFVVKLAVVSKNGCVSDTASKTLVIESIPNVDFNFGATCTGKPITFTNTSSNSYGSILSWSWDFGNNANSSDKNPVYSYNQFGNYAVKLTATTIGGCSAANSKNISISRVNIFAGNDTIVAINQPLRLSALGAAVYRWSPPVYLDNANIYNPVAVLGKDVTYYLQGTTAEGCTGFDTLNIKVYKGPEIYVPGAFTPNGDNLNDIIKPIIPGVLTLEYYSIYNRWGKLVFTTAKIGDGWDGTLIGVRQPGGAYVWICRVKDYTGKIMEKKGSVILIR